MKLSHSLLLLTAALSTCALSLTAFAFSSMSTRVKTPPNIIMIVVDDLGWSDIGYNQTTDLFETPNIDALARQSLQFDNAYAGAANCAPSRAVLMSGQYGPRHGVYTVSPSARGNAKARKLIPIKNQRGLKPDVITLAEALKTAGYATGHFGKWHLGADPDSQGFDINVAGSHQGMTFHYFSPYELPNIQDGPKGEYLTHRLTSEVIDWVRTQKDTPFFAYLPYYTVHTPFQAAADKVKKYHQKGITDEKQATYAAMVELMDSNVGRILTALEAENIAANTLVIFTSDNGGYRMSNFPSPLRAGKGSYYDGGLRVPLLVRWPDHIPSGVNHTPVINADFYPTLLSVANAQRPNQVLDGIDLSSVLLDQQFIESRDLFWHFPVYLQARNAATDQSQDPLFRTRPGSAMRSGSWKLIHYFEDDEYELYDLAKDMAETHNLAAKLPEKLNELKAKLQAWRLKTGADMPTQLNPEYDADINQQLIDELKIHTKFE
ncbi:sulfatase [Thalassotalea litorea]|uniref:sulfatase n=1 Tax=Thalassotalea litorea TaxID=2020715 RepID=UPI003734D5BA